MPFLFAALYGLFSGFFDVLPVSSFAHQSILQSVFGISDSPYFLRLLVHIASLSALIFASMSSVTALMREQRILTLPRRKTLSDRKLTYELRFVKTAAVAILFSTILALLLSKNAQPLVKTGILCIINGVLVLVPEYLPYGNKTAKHMSRLDAAFFGALGGLGVIFGISRIAIMQFYASLRGADRSRSCNWVLLATIPALLVLCFFDIVGVFTAGFGAITFISFLSSVLGAILSFFGTFAGVTLIRFLSAKVGFVGFGYYSIGAGLLTFFLYLTV